MKKKHTPLKLQLQLGISVTERCNLTCRHCLRAERGAARDIDVPLVERIVDQAVPLGAPRIALSGGEALLHPKIWEITDIISKRELSFHLVSNGTTYPRHRERLLKQQPWLSGLSFSIDGPTAELHDAVRGPGSFRKVMLSVGLAVRDGFAVSVQCMVTPANRNRLSEMAALAEQMGVHLLFFGFVQPVPRAADAGLVLDPDGWVEAQGKIEDLIARYPDMIGLSCGGRSTMPYANCRVQRNTDLNVDCRGRLTYCCQISSIPEREPDLDVVADLHETPLVEAIEAQLELGSRVIRERFRHYLDNPDDPWLHHHCCFCMDRFGKIRSGKTDG